MYGPLLRRSNPTQDRVPLRFQLGPPPCRRLRPLSVEAESIDLPVTFAIPCGLILNELVSNAFKHGFPNERAGTIMVRFTRLESGRLALVCSDDGVGIPEGFDWQNAGSLGLRIVQILSRQIGATFALDRTKPGTSFELTFSAQDT